MFRHVDVVCLCQCCVLHDLQFVSAGDDARGDHTEEAYSRACLITAL